jgi:hypothetical protein
MVVNGETVDHRDLLRFCGLADMSAFSRKKQMLGSPAGSTRARKIVLHPNISGKVVNIYSGPLLRDRREH